MSQRRIVDDSRALDTPERQAPKVEVTLLGGFGTSIEGNLVTITPAAQRLIALLAIESRPVMRQYVAGRLWPDHLDIRALGNLRSTLWRIRKDCPNIVLNRGDYLLLEHNVRVDTRDVINTARRLVQPNAACSDSDLDPTRFKGDLLPDWYSVDDWVILERERLRQLCLHALEAISNRLLGLGRYAEAVDAALLAISSEPFRESAHRTLIQAHLAEGNRNEAIRQYSKYRDILAEELGSAPSVELEELVATFKND